MLLASGHRKAPGSPDTALFLHLGSSSQSGSLTDERGLQPGQLRQSHEAGSCESHPKSCPLPYFLHRVSAHLTVFVLSHLSIFPGATGPLLSVPFPASFLP